MAKCTAPINGHRTESGRLSCPVCGRLGGRRAYFPAYRDRWYTSNSISYSSGTTNSGKTNSGSKQKAKWSPAWSTVLYTPAQIRTLTPVRENIINQPAADKYDVFLCHAWDDRKEAAKELSDKLTGKGIKVWFSEKDLPVGTPMLREIDKGLAKSRAGLVLVTPAFLKRIEAEGVAEKELSALLAKDRLIPIVHNTTYDALRDVSPLLGSRSGFDTREDSLDEIVSKIVELFTESSS